MLDWFAPTGKPVLILLSKTDKLTRQQANRTLRKVNDWLAQFYPRSAAQLFSSATHSWSKPKRLWLNGLSADRNLISNLKNKKPPAKGEQNRGRNALIRIKAPAQGGEAGDEKISSTNEITSPAHKFPSRLKKNYFTINYLLL